MSTAEVHDVLVAARNMIDLEGWGQASIPGGFYDRPGSCANTAINKVADRRVLYRWEPQAALTDALGLARSAAGLPNLRALFLWNDTPGRTKEEVLALFDKAIQVTAPAPPDPTWSDLTEDVEREVVHA